MLPQVYRTIILFVGILGPVAIGMALPRRRRVYWAATIGFVLNLAMTMAEGGPQLCVGSVVWPLFAILLAAAGGAIRTGLIRVGWLADPDAYDGHLRCAKCGYRLTGLPENRCAECGTPFDPHRPSPFRIRRRR